MLGLHVVAETVKGRFIYTFVECSDGIRFCTFSYLLNKSIRLPHSKAVRSVTVQSLHTAILSNDNLPRLLYHSALVVGSIRT